MFADAHVHVGYVNCRKSGKVTYYSPRRVVGVLDRCGVDEFVVSSTSAQASPTVKDLLKEAEEIKRIAGDRAHVFYWVTWHLFRQDRKLVSCVDGLYEGIKLHEQEGHWIEQHYDDLLTVLDIARARQLPVQFHCGPDKYCSPARLMDIARRYSDVRFDFAHCRPMDEMASVIAQCDNVWTDTAYMSLGDFARLSEFEWHHRLLFGTDIPIWVAYEDVSLTVRYREYARAIFQTGLLKEAEVAFATYFLENEGIQK